MKKKFLTALVMTALSFSAMAQSDGFFSSNYKEYNTNRAEPIEGSIPIVDFNYYGNAFHEDLYNEVIGEEAPIGNGILSLSILGITYLLTRNKRKEDQI